MHEASLMREVLDLAENAMREQGGARVHQLTLRIGTLAGVVPEAMQFAFDAMKVDTPAEHAVLTMEIVPARLLCLACAEEFGTENYPDVCPRCGQAEVEVRQGTELDLVSVEISGEG